MKARLRKKTSKEDFVDSVKSLKVIEKYQMKLIRKNKYHLENPAHPVPLREMSDF